VIGVFFFWFLNSRGGFLIANLALISLMFKTDCARISDMHLV
jgi:hypothetical protein